jgi:hypothetical protein
VSQVNKQEADDVLEQDMQRRRAIPYSELRKLVLARHIDVLVVDLPSVSYQMEIQYFWADKAEGPIRVSGGIDDGRFWSALSPLTKGFAKAPDGSFVGE